MMKENENCVQEKLNDYVMQQPWTSLSTTGKVRKTLLNIRQGLRKVFCNKVFSLQTVWFITFVFLVAFLIFFAITFYFYTDYVYEQVTVHRDRKLTDQQKMLTYVQYLKQVWKPIRRAMHFRKHTQSIKII